MKDATHTSMEQLLGLRDGEPEAGVADHVAGCEQCANELERLHQSAARLRALPVRRPPRDRWSAVRAAALAERRRRNWWYAGRAAVAFAATLALVVAVRAGREGEPPITDSTGELAVLMEQSQELEATLRAIGPDGRVLNGRAANAVVQLEDQIAWIDARLGEVGRSPTIVPESVDLWQQRVELLDALVGVHVTRAASVGF
jgi:hypothetical protein